MPHYNHPNGPITDCLECKLENPAPGQPEQGTCPTCTTRRSFDPYLALLVFGPATLIGLVGFGVGPPILIAWIVAGGLYYAIQNQ